MALFNGLSIRSAQTADLPTLSLLLVEGFQLVPPPLKWLSGLVVAGLQTDIRYRLARPSLCQVFVAVDRSGQVVGTVEVQIQQRTVWSGGWGGYLSNLTVDPTFRGVGVASLLIQACEQQVLAWGQNHLLMHVMGENASARRLYLRSGYFIQSRTQWVRLGSGKFEERLLVSRRLAVIPSEEDDRDEWMTGLNLDVDVAGLETMPCGISSSPLQ
jgi:ribosomal protein S18 acetylase RimI-like enzyme